MAERKKQSFLQGALILSIAAILTKIIGALFFKIPLQNINMTAYGYFSTAFDVYVPLYTVSTCGFPVAVSRMVSESLTLGRFRDLRVIHRVANRVFLITGSVGTVLMLIAAFLYPNFVNMPDMKLTMLIMAPSILFCCMVSAYRGVYEGSRNMYPTAISQTLEAVGKLIFGISLAAGALQFGQWEFSHGRPVYGHMAATSAQSLSYSLPYIAAGSMVGVTAGSFVSLFYLIIRYSHKGDGVTREELAASPRPYSKQRIFRSLLRIAVPVALGTLATQLTTLIDSFSLQKSLAVVMEKHGDIIRSLYSAQIAAGTSADKVIAYLSGQRQTALTWVNLVPNITLSLGISALPVITAAWAAQDRKRLKSMVTQVLRITLLISLPSGFGLAVMARPILNMFNGAEVAAVAGPQLEVLGVAVTFICLVAPIYSMLQAIGRADIPVKIVLVGGVIKVVLNTVLIMNPYINIMGSAYSTLVCYIVMVMLSLLTLRRVVGVRINWSSIFIKPTFATILCSAAAWTFNVLLKFVFPARIVPLLAILIAGFVYAWALLSMKIITKDDILMLPKGQKIAQTLEKHDWIG